MRGSNIGIWEFDMPGGEIYNSRANFTNIWEQLGLERPEVPPGFETVFDLVHPDDRERLDRAIQDYLSGKTSQFEVEHRVRREDGSYRWMLTRGVAMRDPSSRPIRFIGSCIDITDHRHAQEALRESEGRFRGTFENAAVGIAHKDADGRFLRVNETYCEIVGYTRLELLARTFQDITYAEDLETELEQYLSLMRGELPSYSLEKRYIRKDGSLIWIDVSISLQRDAAGQPAYAIAVLQDISERKRLEEESRQAREAAESANRAKDEFLANVSHEIRTPMNAIIGMTELVLDTPMNDDQRQCLETVKSAADNLLAIINDLLDFSKIEAGKLELDPTDFALRPMLGDTLRALAMRAHRKGLELVFKLEPDVPDALVGDAGRLRQILFNLVDNAIKFTELRRGGDPRGSRRRPGCGGGDRPAVHGERHRHRHPARKARDDLPSLRARRHLDDPEIWRHRVGPDHFGPPRRPDGRHDHRAERAGPRQYVHLHGAVRASAAPAGVRRLESTRGRAPRAARADRR